MDMPTGLSGVGLEATDLAGGVGAGPGELTRAFDSAIQSVSTRTADIQPTGVSKVTDNQIDTKLLPDQTPDKDITVDSTIDSMKEVMDYATEMHLFVRSSTQIGSAMNTLIKGQ